MINDFFLLSLVVVARLFVISRFSHSILAIDRIDLGVFGQVYSILKTCVAAMLCLCRRGDVY